MSDERVDRLAEIAIELAVRVRDDDPEANGRWLEAVCPTPRDWFELCFILAAGVADDRPWLHSTAWAWSGLPADPQDLAPCGTWAAAKRHRWHKEPLCLPCKEAERQRGSAEYLRRRNARAQAADSARPQAVDNSGGRAAVA